MKKTAKQWVITVLFVVILFIPTYIAISHYYTQSGSSVPSKYDVTVTNEKNVKVSIDGSDTDEVARIILKLGDKLSPYSGTPSLLPPKQYKVTVKEQGVILSSYTYYFNTGENSVTYVKDADGKYYTLEYKDAKTFLSHRAAYYFYDNSSLPTLSISGGSVIIPTRGDWKYRAVNGSMLRSPEITVASKNESYTMRSSSTLSFSLQPTKCTVAVYNKNGLIDKYSTLSDVPYNLIDSYELSFRIDAEWDMPNYQGSAHYEFSSKVGLDPVFTVLDNRILSGEFFVIMAENVSSPQNIEFSSIPEIGVTPVFYKEGDRAFTLIPIAKEIASPCEYIFTMKYGGTVSRIAVAVDERDIYERSYDCSNITVNRTKEAVEQYRALLKEIGSVNESVRYFNGKFLDYAASTTQNENLPKIILGYGHHRTPSNGDAPFRLDGVDYSFPVGAEIPAVCAGKVVHVGNDPLLGNFAVVDHGFGLKTWYCNLSSVSVSVGTIVATGQSVGVSGSVGYKNINGVFFITTLYEVPVSPYPIQEEGLSVFH